MDRHIWIQLENHPWDLAPNNIDRMTGQHMEKNRDTNNPDPDGYWNVTLTSPETGVSHTVRMFKPMTNDGITIKDSLILRRYTENWDKPDDRKVNPWDLNEPDPTDTGTMGTIPGPVIECDVGDRVIVHFRNKDNRDVSYEKRSHSLHTHGFVFDTTSDGAYPLSPEDRTQPVGPESDLWKDVKPRSNFKRGDRVPPGGTFTYTWNTFGWPTTAGVWLYHDHSIYDHENVGLGAIGIVVIHNPSNTENDVLNPDLPGGSDIGSPVDQNGFFIDPPTNAQYLLLFHEVGSNMCMNGRWKLGNAPTLVAGVNTKMVFGIVTMGDAAHTFHLHGHRWVINGPDGIHPAEIEASVQNRSVSQFEDTRIMSAANSFNFTVRQGSFMGSLFPPDPIQASGLGEWHMHCHILMHMMNGMMGSLLVVNRGTFLKGLLQSGFFDTSERPNVFTVAVIDFAFSPNSLTVPNGTTVTFDFQAPLHTVKTSRNSMADPITINNGGGDLDAVPQGQRREVTINGMAGGVIEYHCGIHGPGMSGIIRIEGHHM